MTFVYCTVLTATTYIPIAISLPGEGSPQLGKFVDPNDRSNDTILSIDRQNYRVLFVEPDPFVVGGFS